HDGELDLLTFEGAAATVQQRAVSKLDVGILEPGRRCASGPQVDRQDLADGGGNQATAAGLKDDLLVGESAQLAGNGLAGQPVHTGGRTGPREHQYGKEYADGRHRHLRSNGPQNKRPWPYRNEQPQPPNRDTSGPVTVCSIPSRRASGSRFQSPRDTWAACRGSVLASPRHVLWAAAHPTAWPGLLVFSGRRCPVPGYSRRSCPFEGC